MGVKKFVETEWPALKTINLSKFKLSIDNNNLGNEGLEILMKKCLNKIEILWLGIAFAIQAKTT